MRLFPMTSLKQSLDLQPGDIIGFSGANPTSDFINLVTYGIPRWSISHVGICAAYPDGQVLIFESTTEAADPCYIQHAYVTGTQAQKAEPRIASYKGRVWHYPLVKPLRSWESKALTRFLVNDLGRRYDSEGARRAGAKLWAWIQAQLHEESREALFCSEWVAAALRHIERFDTVNISSWSPNALLREGRRRGLISKSGRLK